MGMIPEHLVCKLSGQLYSDPVLISSGQTFERRDIVRYFDIARERAERDKIEEAVPAEEYDESSYFVCPATSQPVNPNTLISNTRIKE